MVKTRHTVDADEESPGNFPSIDRRRSRLSRSNPKLEEDGSDDSGVIQFKNGKKAARRKKTEESPSPKRSLRTAAKRVSYVEDFIDDDFAERSSRRRLRNVIDEDTDDDNVPKIDGSPGEEAGSLRSTRLRRRVSMSGDGNQGDREDDEEMEEEEVGRRSSRRQLRRSVGNRRVMDRQAKAMKAEALSEMEQEGIRRSSRTKKLLYHTFDQKVMEQSGYLADERPGRKRRRVEVETDTAQTEDDEGEFKDMYSRVKRKRKCVKRDMYGMPIEESDEDGNDEEENSDSDDSDEGDSDNGEEGEEEENEDENEERKSVENAPRSYYLRENKPRTQLYNAPLEEKRPRTLSRMFKEHITHMSPARRKRPTISEYLSPARRNFRGSRRRAAFHGSSSTSSSSSDSSDEERFQRRKAKSMKKSRQRCLPMNFDPDDISRSNVLRDRQKVGSSLADVDPMNIDRSVTFDSVGGLGKHIRALKEMVVFPLMYPEIFERFKIAPPRGVLFYGPPGTGKTLVARALANECSADDRRVAFYMRKGADCLSKWVGESERQLRLLFDQAYQTRPSIIFFDEIDGLAPVRSSRQDQIHSSIVSTLLALMDGLDSRGEIVVIGATNRIDSIDPALRRPGRFDREFLFPLPSVQARSQILKIHTKDWNPKLCDKFVTEVAENCTGYCGADMRALCTEAALLALRRRYPQIYTSGEKLQIDVSSIMMSARDFYTAMRTIVPTSQRSLAAPGRALSATIAPLLTVLFQEVVTKLNEIFPSVLSQLANLDTADSDKGEGELEPVEDDSDGGAAIYEQKHDRRRKSNIPDAPERFLNFTSYAHQHPSTHRPRLLLCGSRDQGQTSHLAPAVLHHMEQLPVHVLDLASLYAVSARTPEEGCAQIFREARRTSPSIVYLPHVNQWWGVLPDTVKTTVLTLIQDVDPTSPLLVLATSEDRYADLDFNVQDLFDEYSGEVITMRNPSSEERRSFFKDLLLNQATKLPPQGKVTATRLLEVLPKAPPPEPRKLTDTELVKIREHEEATLRELRLFLRDVLNKLGRDRKFFIFTKPVDIEDVPDYYDIIKVPMDLSTMMSKIDLHQYLSAKQFLVDIEQICMNALEYNPDKDPQSRVIRHRACALRDTAYAIMKAELDPEFEKTCLGIVESRKKRGEDSTTTVPAFYHTKPLISGATTSTSTSHSSSMARDTPPSPVRLSTRLRREKLDELPSLEEVERTARILRREAKQNSPDRKKGATSSQDETQCASLNSNNNSLDSNISNRNTSNSRNSGSRKSQGSVSEKKSRGSDHGSSGKKKVKRSIWGRSSYKRRRKVRRNRSLCSEGDEGEEDEEELDIVTDEETEDDPENNPDCEDNGAESDTEQSQSQSQTSQSTTAGSHTESLNHCLSVDVTMKSPGESSRSPRQRSPRGHEAPAQAQRSPAAETRSHMHTSPVAHAVQVHKPTQDSGQKSPRVRHSSGQVSPRISDSHTTDLNHRSPGRSSLTPKHQEKTSKCSVVSSSAALDISENARLHSAQDSTTSQVKTKSIEAESVHMVNGFIDSGIGSSDSNCDSNHSGKITTSSENSDQTSEKQSLQVLPNTEDTEEQMEIKEAASPQFRVTRSRIQTKTQERAVEVLRECAVPVIVDRERLVRLLDSAVALTDGYDVGHLEKLYSVLGQCVYQHRLENNKTALIEMMERRLRQFTSNVAERLKAEQARSLTMS